MKYLLFEAEALQQVVDSILQRNDLYGISNGVTTHLLLEIAKFVEHHKSNKGNEDNGKP